MGDGICRDGGMRGNMFEKADIVIVGGGPAGLAAAAADFLEAEP